jgi:hypothetical protein
VFLHHIHFVAAACYIGVSVDGAEVVFTACLWGLGVCYYWGGVCEELADVAGGEAGIGGVGVWVFSGMFVFVEYVVYAV